MLFRKKRFSRFIVLVFLLIIFLINFVYSENGAFETGGAGDLKDIENGGGIPPENPDPPAKAPEGGTYNPATQEFTGPVLENNQGQRYEDVENVIVNPDGSIKSGEQVGVGNNQYTNVENFNVDNQGNILAQYLELQALQASIFTMINPINKCKVTFNVPAGGKITISNRDKTRFETISSSGIEQGLACQCSAGISFTATENNAKLVVASSEKLDVHRYDMENLCLDYKNNKDYKETFCSKEENSFSKLSCASGIDTLGLGKEASYRYISEKDNKRNFMINAPLESSGISVILLKYGTTYQTQEKSSIIDLVKQDFTLKNIIEFKNYLDKTVYKGFNKDNIAEFEINEGILQGLTIENKISKDSRDKIAEIYPNEGIKLNEYANKLVIKNLYKKCNNTFFKTYIPDFGIARGEFWTQGLTLNQDTEKAKSHKFNCYNINVQEMKWYQESLTQFNDMEEEYRV